MDTTETISGEMKIVEKVYMHNTNMPAVIHDVYGKHNCGNGRR